MFESPLADPTMGLPQLDGVVITRCGKDNLISDVITGHPVGTVGPEEL